MNIRKRGTSATHATFRDAGRAFGVATLVFALVVCAGTTAVASSKPQKSHANSVARSAAATALAAAERIPTFKAPGPAVSAAKVRGRRIAIVTADLVVPLLASVASAIESAATRAGLKYSLFNGQDVVANMIQGLQQAKVEKANAVVLLGEAPEKVIAGLQPLKAAGIPVISVTNNQPNPSAVGQGSGPDIYATVSPSFSQGGALVADYIAVHGPANAQIGLMTSNDILGSHFVVNGFKAELAKVCPACRIVVTDDTQVEHWSSSVAGLASSMLVAHPKLNYMFPIFDAMGVYATSGITSASNHGSVKVVAFNGTPGASLSLVQKGSIFVADPGSSGAWAGWATVDQAIRGMLKQPPASPYVPLRVLDTADLKGVNTSSTGKLYGTAYVAGYLHLWGVS